MDWHVIVDNEWYFTGTHEQCCEVVDTVCSDDEFYGSCTMVSDAEFYGYEEA